MAATVVNDAVMVPADVIKQRLQVSQGQYKGVLDCIMQTRQREGLAAFYRQASLLYISAEVELAHVHADNLNSSSKRCLLQMLMTSLHHAEVPR